MPSSPFGSTHVQTTSGVACHHCLLAAQTVERRRAWHRIIAVGLANTVRRRRVWHAIRALGRQTRSNDVGRGLPLAPLTSTHGQTTSGVACHHHLWAAQTVGLCRAWHAIIALGRQTQSNDVGGGMTSPPLDSAHGRQHWAWNHITALGQHTQSNNVGFGMPSSPFGSTNDRTTSGVACHHHLWAAQTVE